MYKFLIPLILIASQTMAGERPTLGACMSASAIAGANHYEWQEKKFTREDCEAITATAPKAAVEPAPATTLEKPDPVEIHIHNALPPPAPVIFQKPAPTINIHIHNESAPAIISPQSTLSDAPATNLKHITTPHNKYVTKYIPSDVRPDLFLFPPRCCFEYPSYRDCDPYYGAGCGH
jgi:hypothetical protein